MSAGHEAIRVDAPLPDPTPAETRRRATIITPAAPETADRDAASRAQAAAERLSAALSGDSLLHAQPPSLHQSWTRHRQAAEHFEAVLLRYPRYLWGVIHTALKAALHAAEWVTESPPRLLVACLLIAAFWIWG